MQADLFWTGVMMADHKTLYAQALYYDIIFERNVSHELAFAVEMYRKLNGDKEPHSLIDIACGPGYHALEAAQQGMRTIGLDLREEMVKLGAEKAAKLGVHVEWIAEDMRTFRLNPPVDIALTMFDGIDVLVTDEDIIAHFGAMHNNITPGGIYLIDISHPKDNIYGNYGNYSFTGQRDGIHVKIAWEVHEDFNLVTGLSDTTTHMTATHADGRVETFDSRAQERIYLPRELNPLVRLAGGFKLIGWYGSFRENQPLDYSHNSNRQVGIYQRV
jgi:cyclopropane fatty-acyl-phospholipid synthase-like methyltransferase